MWFASILLYAVLMVIGGVIVYWIVRGVCRPTGEKFQRTEAYKNNERIHNNDWSRDYYYKVAYKEYERNVMQRARGLATAIALPIALILGLVGANAITYAWTAHHGKSTQATIGEVTQQFGFKSGSAYPLVLGNRFAGTSGDLHVSGGLFFVSADAHFAPATAVTIGFDHNGKSYMLELPTSKITFIKSDTTKPSVKLWIKYAGSDFVYYNGSSKKGTGNIDTLVERTYGPCDPTWHNLVLQCDHEVANKTVTIGKTIESRGLAPIVQEYFDRAEITLTSAQYNKLLGG